MLPGGGQAKPIDVDNQWPFDGAYYDDQSTWSLVPLQKNGPQKGKIRNVLLAQTISLWLNISNSSTLGSIGLVDDTLVTRQTASCGSDIPVGIATKFGLPHDIVVYLNNGNGYAPTVEGLFQLANDVLGGVVTGVDPSNINEAVDKINNAFDGCRILVGTIPYNNQLVTGTGAITMGTKVLSNTIAVVNQLKVFAYPNPYDNHFQLQVVSPTQGMAKVEFFTSKSTDKVRKIPPLRALAYGSSVEIVERISSSAPAFKDLSNASINLGRTSSRRASVISS